MDINALLYQARFGELILIFDCWFFMFYLTVLMEKMLSCLYNDEDSNIQCQK